MPGNAENGSAACQYFTRPYKCGEPRVGRACTPGRAPRAAPAPCPSAVLAAWAAQTKQTEPLGAPGSAAAVGLQAAEG